MMIATSQLLRQLFSMVDIHQPVWFIQLHQAQMTKKKRRWRQIEYSIIPIFKYLKL